MELRALVKYNGALAEYKITEETKGIYNAVLQKYEGDVHCPPSTYIILTKSIRKWIASIFEPRLINTLGKIIDRNSWRFS
jgi:hypothetical protein